MVPQQLNTQMIVRLKKEMQRLGFNARQLAVQAAVGQSFVYDVLSGKSCNPTTNKLASVAEVLGVSVPYLVNGTTNDNELHNVTHGNIIAVSEILPNRDGVVTRQEVNYPSGSSHYFNKGWLKTHVHEKYNQLRVLRVSQEHMHPTLKVNDVVLIDLSRTIPNPPGIFILYDGTGLVFKRLEFLPSDPTLVRVSSDYSPYSASNCALETLHIWGRVVWFSRQCD